MRALRLAFVFWLIGSAAAWAALQFPPLSGRVVDAAHILSPSAVSSLDRMLADYEQKTAHQVVVATLPSLQGASIEEFGYQLGRHWQIGQKGKDNGVLLIVAPQERKVRIEVGYGLEPLLTDAASSEIVQGIILPQFRVGHMEQGVIEGTQAIIDVLGGQGVPSKHVPNQLSSEQLWVILGLIAWFIFFRFFSYRHPLIASALLMNNAVRFGGPGMGNSGWGGGSGGGFFSGGGGSFGGGGASGGW